MLNIILIYFILICSGCTTTDPIRERNLNTGASHPVTDISNDFKEMEYPGKDDNTQDQSLLNEEGIKDEWLIVQSEDPNPESGFQILEKYIQNNPDIKLYIETKESLPNFIKVTDLSILNLAYFNKESVFVMDIQASSAKHIGTYPLSKYPYLVNIIRENQDLQNQEIQKPILEVSSMHKGEPNAEVMEKTKGIIEMKILNSGDTSAKNLIVNLSSISKHSSSEIQSQKENINFIDVNEEKKVLFEISCPDVEEVQDIFIDISIDHPDFGHLCNTQASLTCIDGEYKAYRAINNSYDKKKKKRLALAYLNSVENKEISGKYISEVKSILDSIMWQHIRSTCNKELCEEYFSILSEDKGDHYDMVREKYMEINELIAAKNKDSYQNYKSFILKYKEGVCVDEVRERIETSYWHEKPMTKDILIQLGDIYKDQLEYDRAERAYIDAIALDENYALGYEKLGEFLFRELKDKNTAREYLLSAENLKSENYEVYFMLADIFSRPEADSGKKAYEYYNKAIAINPDCIECRYFRARECLPLLMREKAVEDFQWIVTNSDDSTFYYKSANRYLDRLTGNQ